MKKSTVVAITAVACMLVGAILASTVHALNTVGAILALVGLGVLAAWAFLTGKF